MRSICSHLWLAFETRRRAVLLDRFDLIQLKKTSPSMKIYSNRVIWRRKYLVTIASFDELFHVNEYYLFIDQKSRSSRLQIDSSRFFWLSSAWLHVRCEISVRVNINFGFRRARKHRPVCQRSKRKRNCFRQHQTPRRFAPRKKCSAAMISP